jgi:predicted aminopeptidase
MTTATWLLVARIVRGCAVVLGLSPLSGCGLHYVVASAGHQAELLGSTEPVDNVLAGGRLSAGEEQRLRLFAEVKAFGARIGLSATGNYAHYAVRWHRRIWNVSAAPPLSLEPRTWWFPIVGRVPYLGFFDDADVDAWRTRLAAEGHEVYVREVGAYSTLGWFRDPVLPAMLRWDEPRIAETVCHELAHATLWIPGSVSFNESFASVVGVAAGDRFLVEKYGEGSPEVRDARDREHDGRVFTGLLVELTAALAAVYGDPNLTDPERTARKAALLAGFPARVREADLRDPDRWEAWARDQTWNNARLSQFRTYHTGHADFEALLARREGDLTAFIEEVRRITRGARDPFAALRARVAEPVGGP